MKEIKNWRNAVVFDVEADNLLDDATKVHCLSYLYRRSLNTVTKMEGIKDLMMDCIKSGTPVVAHNGIGYDIPLLEKLLGIDLSELMVIDTMMLSWALNPKRVIHGLDSYGKDYGIAKPKVDDWENLSLEEYTHRCEEDVKINSALWDDFKGRLEDIYSKAKVEIDSGNVGGVRVSDKEVTYLDQYVNNSTVDEYIDRYLTFLMYKGDSGRLRQKTKFLADIDHIEKTIKPLEVAFTEAKALLESIMPKVAKYSKKNFPPKPYKKPTKKQIAEGNTRGSLSATGKSWNAALEGLGAFDDLGNELTIKVTNTQLKVLKNYEAPNANGVDQIKSLLFSKGWKPESFKYEKDEDAFKAWVEGGFRGAKPKSRAIPQITIAGEGGKVLCPSVARLAEESPEIKHYTHYGMIKHRLGLLKGFLRDSTDGYLTAGVKGYTNTLRDMHKELTNLPSIDKAYGEDIRGSLIAGSGKICIGSDLSSLEDRVKHHFMLAYDREYVETMMDKDYDPHIQMALTANLITQDEFDDFKKGIKSANAKKARKMGKACNYASVYGAGAETIAKSAGVSNAVGKALHTAYWKLNWSVKAIAEDQCVITDNREQMWLINPINGFCYTLRKEKDIFSTLCQGTGSFFFDRWVDNVMEGMYNEFNCKRLSAAFHDEYVAVFKDTASNRQSMEKITLNSIEQVNQEYFLRRELGCDVQFGDRYSEIH